MKFTALTLVVLLAVGSHAASLNSDAPVETPRELQQMRSILDHAILSVMGSVKNVLGTLEHPKYDEYKTKTAKNLDEMYEGFKTWQATASAFTDTIYNQIHEFIKKAEEDDPIPDGAVERLRNAIKQHTDYYYQEIESILREFMPTHRNEMNKLSARLQPVIDSIGRNLDDTKQAAFPLLTVINNRITKQLTELKSMVEPYVEDMKKTVDEVYESGKSMTEAEYDALQKQVEKDFEEIGEKFNEVYLKIYNAFNKS